MHDQDTARQPLVQLQAIHYDARTDGIQPVGQPLDEDASLQELRALGPASTLVPVIGWDPFRWRMAWERLPATTGYLATTMAAAHALPVGARAAFTRREYDVTERVDGLIHGPHDRLEAVERGEPVVLTSYRLIEPISEP